MPRLASLWLPDLAIDRIRRADRNAGRLDSPAAGRDAHSLPLPAIVDPPSGNRVADCSCPRAPGFRPGARWARADGVGKTAPVSSAGALITAHRDGQRLAIAAACPAARAFGLAPGLALAQARILVPGLEVRDADPDGDSAWLARLGLFAARRWTPRAAVSGADGLWLDLTGTSHLFGGERAMGERILGFCARLGFTARIAVAGTSGAAHALARFSAEPLILSPSGEEAAALGGLPLAALRLGEDALATARRLGIERISELVAMPRPPLQRRFGSALLTRLDQALGRLAEPFDPIVPAAPPAIALRFLEPIATAEAIEETVAEAMRRLVPLLEQGGLGVRRLVLDCERVDGEVRRLAIGTVRSTRDGPHLCKLLAAKIGDIDPGFGIEAIRLAALRVEPLAPQPIAGELGGGGPARDLAALIDRLTSRLGARRLYRLGAVESDLPERSVRRACPLAEVANWPAWPRPVRLLVPPEPVEHVMAVHPDGGPMRFNWRGKAYRVAAADGPERLYGEWWRRADEAEAVRDYFQVEDEEGKRFWLFRKGDPDRPGTGDLSWHLHGVFA